MVYWLHVIGWLIGIGYGVFVIVQFDKKDYFDMYTRTPKFRFVSNFVMKYGIPETLFMVVRLILMSLIVFILCKGLISI
jgi:hypothetical protein